MWKLTRWTNFPAGRIPGLTLVRKYGEIFDEIIVGWIKDEL